jgi:hypothetical protein
MVAFKPFTGLGPRVPTATEWTPSGIQSISFMGLNAAFSGIDGEVAGILFAMVGVSFLRQAGGELRGYGSVRGLLLYLPQLTLSVSKPFQSIQPHFILLLFSLFLHPFLYDDDFSICDFMFHFVIFCSCAQFYTYTTHVHGSIFLFSSV